MGGQAASIAIKKYLQEENHEPPTIIGLTAHEGKITQKHEMDIVFEKPMPYVELCDILNEYYKR